MKYDEDYVSNIVYSIVYQKEIYKKKKEFRKLIADYITDNYDIESYSWSDIWSMVDEVHQHYPSFDHDAVKLTIKGVIDKLNLKSNPDPITENEVGTRIKWYISRIKRRIENKDWTHALVMYGKALAFESLLTVAESRRHKGMITELYSLGTRINKWRRFVGAVRYRENPKRPTFSWISDEIWVAIAQFDVLLERKADKVGASQALGKIIALMSILRVDEIKKLKETPRWQEFQVLLDRYEKMKPNPKGSDISVERDRYMLFIDFESPTFIWLQDLMTGEIAPYGTIDEYPSEDDLITEINSEKFIQTAINSFNFNRTMMGPGRGEIEEIEEGEEVLHIDEKEEDIEIPEIKRKLSLEEIKRISKPEEEV